ncbi:MAG: biotin-dependent carboxyltransferase family protein [Acidobacteriota bacterium]|nr:MAG: biotin-dependent carboxyltransferase family protein [Acidobacteriota bacterium]
MSLKITKAGILDTVQDLGRTGYRALGVNPGGAADRDAVRILNTLLGNDENAAVIEMHFPAATIEFETDSVIAVGGAHFRPHLEGFSIPEWTSLPVKKSESLSFAGRNYGARVYLAVRGGIETEQWLGSSSTNLFVKAGGAGGRRLEKGDVLGTGIENAFGPSGLRAGRTLTERFLRRPVLRVTEGPENNLLTAFSANAFEIEEFEVRPDSNRMGIRLDGPQIHTVDDGELVSSAVAPGTIQLLPDGSPLILGADSQTTGGYPRIARVISADLSLAAQASHGDRVRFRAVSLEEAYAAMCRFEKDLSFLRLGLRFRAP